jgi:hypothetical protein
VRTSVAPAAGCPPHALSAGTGSSRGETTHPRGLQWWCSQIAQGTTSCLTSREGSLKGSALPLDSAPCPQCKAPLRASAPQHAGRAHREHVPRQRPMHHHRLRSSSGAQTLPASPLASCIPTGLHDTPSGAPSTFMLPCRYYGLYSNVTK